MIVIISCGHTKRKEKSPAWKLYTGSYFRSCLRCASRWAKRKDIYIISAKYGIVTLDTELEPYEVKVKGVTNWWSQNRIEGAVDIATVEKQIKELKILRNPPVVFIGGRDYLRLLKQLIPDIKAPLQEYTTGGNNRQKGFLKRWAQ